MKVRPVPAPDLKLRFIDWAKQHGHNPETGAATFAALQSDRDLQQRHSTPTPVPPAKGSELRAALRRELEALASEDEIAVKFPPIYAYRGARAIDYRYSLMLVLTDDCVEWTARVWRGLNYQGMLVGRGCGPRINSSHLARMAIEHELDGERPHYVET